MARSVKGRVRMLMAPVCLLAISIGAAGPALADKLVVFKSGKTMRAKSIKKEKGWTRLELDGGNVVGVRTAQVLSVEDAAGAGSAKVDLPNQATTGGGGPARPAYASSGPAYAPQAMEEQQQQESYEPPSEEATDQSETPRQPAGHPGAAINVPGIPTSPLKAASGRGLRRLLSSSANIGNVSPRQQIGSPEGNTGGLQPRQRNDADDAEDDE